MDFGHEQLELTDCRTEWLGTTNETNIDNPKKKKKIDKPLELDIFRRDFTCNTLLWRFSDLINGPSKDKIIDLTKRGIKDAEERRLSTPKDPIITFTDDPVRLIRAAKFVTKYKLKLDDNVKKMYTA
eukprot:UN27653